MNPAEREALAAAMLLAWPSFPCFADKRPACPRGFKDAALPTHGLATLWARHPGELIGIPTGAASGFSVLDVDLSKGGAEWWEKNRGRLPKTRLHETRSGGVHVFFVHRAGIRNTAGRIARGIDTRGDGGYIIWWPATGLGVLNADDLAPWPDWLRPPPPEPVNFTPLPAGPVNSSRYGASALDRACAAIRGAANGAQEATLNRESFSIGQLAGAGILDRATALNRITSAARSMPSYDPRRPWTARELIGKVNRAFGQGLQRPRNPVRRVG
jgi:Bifunctional DNA primase/polymerase, N-terminal